MIAEAVTKDQPPPPQLETGLEWLVTSHTPWGYVEMAHYMNGDEGFLDWGCAVLKASLLLQWVLAVWCTSTFNSSKLILCLNIQTANLEITSWLSLILKLCNLLNSKRFSEVAVLPFITLRFVLFFYQASSLFPKTHFIWMFYYVLNNAKKRATCCWTGEIMAVFVVLFVSGTEVKYNLCKTLAWDFLSNSL